ncbi:GNAT family N-acetyltransferase [Cupriavidus gilardii]|uniref:GNAT family N-acetyltransferase n=1 Tax=Cupriavidus gilardii TaxID=82541 RepID=A0ABY4VMJ9_9BURK|nr:GNAT family N-acetyltransferase [Cupriavidus gilardii]USE78439.1 GNAT family N-acetyltransferase [Cupriavidus gilardii]
MGRRLMDEAVAWAATLNLRAIRLETQSSNVSACRFYAQYGFVLGGYDRYLYSQLNEDVREDVALYWYLFL